MSIENEDSDYILKKKQKARCNMPVTYHQTTNIFFAEAKNPVLSEEEMKTDESHSV